MDVNKLLENAIRLGYEGADAEKFVQKQIVEYEAREERAAQRERDRIELERVKERDRIELERVREKERIELERENKKLELEVLKERSNIGSSGIDTSQFKS